MSIAEELQRLEALHSSGALNDDEYTRAKDMVLNGSGTSTLTTDGPAGAMMTKSTGWLRSLARSNRDYVLGGVCGGLGEHTPLPSWCWRLVFVLLMLTFGIGVIPYVALWICLPVE